MFKVKRILSNGWCPSTDSDGICNGNYYNWSGHIEYLLNGKRHREEGPALQLANGEEYYYLNDKLLLYPKWEQKCLELK